MLNQQNPKSVAHLYSVLMCWLGRFRLPFLLRILFRCWYSRVSCALYGPVQYHPLCLIEGYGRCPRDRWLVVQLMIDFHVVTLKHCAWQVRRKPSIIQSYASLYVRKNAYRPHAATDSRRPRPNTENGTFDIVTTECLRPDGCGACDKVAKNSASYKKAKQKSRIKPLLSSIILLFPTLRLQYCSRRLGAIDFSCWKQLFSHLHN